MTVDCRRSIWKLEEKRTSSITRMEVMKSTSKAYQFNFHHLNFHMEPVHHKLATAPEVSLWLTINSNLAEPRPIFQGMTSERIITSQAGKLIDPVHYTGLPELLELRGTALRDAVTGYVEKLYQPFGTWMMDIYDYDEVIPRCTTGLNIWFDWNYHRGLPKGYLSQPYGQGVVVNDDGRVHVVPHPNKAKKLRIVQYAYAVTDPETVETRSTPRTAGPEDTIAQALQMVLEHDRLLDAAEEFSASSSITLGGAELGMKRDDHHKEVART